MQPTARNLDCTATPNWRASRSHAQIEYVETSTLPVGQLREVEGEERLVAHERACHLAARERRVHLLDGRGTDDDRRAAGVRGPDRADVAAVVEHERALEVDRALERDLRHLAPRGAEPALAHQNVSVSPGSGESTSTPGGASS